VVTGTLISGNVCKEQEVELYPHGRVCACAAYKSTASPPTRRMAGQRTALNLADIEPADLARGMVLPRQERFRAVTQVDCALQLLPSAKPLKHRAPVHFHAGTAEIEAQVRLLDGARR
jgi:selenocysteine-specific elongation factor